MGLIEKIKGFLVGLAALIVIGLGWLLLFIGFVTLPSGNLLFEIVGALFLLYSIAILVFLAYASFKGAPMLSVGLLIIAVPLCIFLVGVWRGLLVILAFAGAGIALLMGIGWWKERKKAVAWELEDQLKELNEQLRSGVITEEEYEEKRKEFLERN